RRRLVARPGPLPSGAVRRGGWEGGWLGGWVVQPPNLPTTWLVVVRAAVTEDKHHTEEREEGQAHDDHEPRFLHDVGQPVHVVPRSEHQSTFQAIHPGMSP